MDLVGQFKRKQYTLDYVKQLIPETFEVGMLESCAGVKGNAVKDSFRFFKKKKEKKCFFV